MATPVYITPLGYLIKPNINKSIKAFSDLIANNYYFPSLAIKFFLFIDYAYYRTIDNYKLGNINTEEFRSKIAYQLGIEKSTKIDSAWNAMCELSPETLHNIAKIFQLQQKEGYKIVIISATNPLQYNYVSAGINQELKDSGCVDLELNPDISIATSFTKHTLDLNKLAEIAIKNKKWNSSEYNIISFDSRITEDALSLEGLSYSFSKGFEDFYDL